MKKCKTNLLSLEISELFSLGMQYFREVGEKFTFYKSLVEGKKTIVESNVSIIKPSNNNAELESTTIVAHESNDVQDISLLITVSKRNQGNFKFKLRYKGFILPPFFRFDSYGDAHWNKIDGIKLNKQQITTPHFHRYHESGYEIAYRTNFNF